MKKLISMLVVLAFAAVGASSSVSADETIIQARSMDVGNPSDAHVQMCIDLTPGDKPIWLPLNAEFWSFQTRAKDGSVVNPDIREVGTAEGCLYLDEYDPPNVDLSPRLYGKVTLGDILIDGWSECTLEPSAAAGAFLGTCFSMLDPDPDQGIAGGIMTSNSVLGAATGSYWTFRIIWD